MAALFLIIFLFTDGLAWTIDLAEIRKFVFDKNERLNEQKNLEYSRNDIYYYDNKDSNSLHHAESEKEIPQYAGEFGYQAYMEKKVLNIVHKGGKYLEELRKSIERYTYLLQNCTDNNFNLPGNATNSTWQPRLELPGSLNLSRSLSCEEVTKTSEHVRRLADLAMHTTRELQDIGYAKKYQEIDYQKENELILKLAWFLDRLAHYTGYDVDSKSLSTERPADIKNSSMVSTLKNNLRRVYSDDRDTDPLPSPITLVNSSEVVRDMMMNCLKGNSSEAAVDRCRYPVPIPPLLEGILNRMSSTSSPPNMAESVIPVTSSQETIEPNTEETQEILIATDNRQNIYPPYLTAVNSKSVRKRSTNDPASTFIKYYAKSKIWLNSNADNINIDNKKDYDVRNEILQKKIFKRSLLGKKNIHLRVPENPLQNLGDYVKSKSTTQFNKNKNEAIEIKNYLENIHHKKSVNKILNKKHSSYYDFISKPLSGISVKKQQKRSATYNKPPRALHIGSLIQLKPIKIINKEKKQFDLKKFIEKIRETKLVRNFLNHRPKRSNALTYREMEKPRISENPFKDISYYIKNKPTTNLNPSLTQAAQARLALEQHFANGNILVARQYGSNYNPLVPQAFYFGFIRTLADS